MYRLHDTYMIVHRCLSVMLMINDRNSNSTILFHQGTLDCAAFVSLIASGIFTILTCLVPGWPFRHQCDTDGCSLGHGM